MISRTGLRTVSRIVSLTKLQGNTGNVKAIVFRVNSAGGSVIASETMRDELRAVKNKGLKVIVSMGEYAASGGVYISTPADFIFAESTTITGSIGAAIAMPHQNARNSCQSY